MESEALVLATAILGAFVGGILTYFTMLRNIYNTSIIQERQKWRESVRSITIELATALDVTNPADINSSSKIKRLRKELQIRINPADGEDREILKACTSDDLVGRIAVLLKHDWERAKYEARPIRSLILNAKRPKFERGKNLPKKAFENKSKCKTLVSISTFIILFSFPWIILNIISPILNELVDSWREVNNYLKNRNL